MTFGTSNGPHYGVAGPADGPREDENDGCEEDVGDGEPSTGLGLGNGNTRVVMIHFDVDVNLDLLADVADDLVHFHQGERLFPPYLLRRPPIKY